VLRDAFADVLPPRILRRGKMGFGLPVGTWFRRELRGYLRDHLSDRSLPIFTYVQYDYVQTLLAEHEGGLRDHGHRLWLLLTLSVWLRRHR
jgi:asparagine synthase (glutamine-hydrolysing)